MSSGIFYFAGSPGKPKAEARINPSDRTAMR